MAAVSSQPPRNAPLGFALVLTPENRHFQGPMPVLNDPAHTDIVRSLSQRVPKLLGIGTDRAPRAIVLVTAHWSTDKPTISSGKRHSLLYDYGGFPPEAYKLRYDAPGSPEVAEDVRRALEAEGLEPELDPKRGKFPVLIFVCLRDIAKGLWLNIDHQQAGTTGSSSPCF